MGRLEKLGQFLKDMAKGATNQSGAIAAGAKATAAATPDKIAKLKSMAGAVGDAAKTAKAKLDEKKAEFIDGQRQELDRLEAEFDEFDARAQESDRKRRSRLGLPGGELTPSEVESMENVATAGDAPSMSREEAAMHLAAVYWIRVEDARASGGDPDTTALLSDLFVEGDEPFNDLIVAALRATEPKDAGDVAALRNKLALLD